MKIICVGRNYGAHARELNNDIPEEPVIFLKPDTALIRPGQDFYLPAFSSDVHHEVELLVRIERAGKNIQEKFAHKYYRQIGLGIDFTARDKQNELKAKGLPWELAKGFDGSAFVSDWINLEDVTNKSEISFSLQKNGEQVQEGQSSDMLFSIDRIISFVSSYFTLRTGDIIFTGTPSGVGPVKSGDHLLGYLEGKELVNLLIK